MDAHKNFAKSTLATPPSGTSGTELVVATGEGALFPAAPFNVTVWPAGVQPTAANAEIMRVTAKVVDTFTVTRAAESSTARTFTNNSQIAATITAKTLTDAEYGAHGIFNVKDPLYGATGDGTTDDTTAIQAALTAAAAAGGGVVYFPHGDYATSVPLTCATNGVTLRGAGAGATSISSLVGFTGSAAIILGNKSTTTVVTTMRCEAMLIDTSASVGVGGIECYGLRDGSGWRDLYINSVDAPSFKTNQAGNGSGAASSRMCEGFIIDNCWAIGGPWDSTAAFLLDGLFEWTWVGSGVRGFSSTDNTNARGVKIGTVAECRGGKGDGGAIVMIKDTGDGSAQTNAGIQFGAWARDVTFDKMTFEGITGPAASFDGSDEAGAGALPFNCRITDPRVYVYGAGETDGFGRDTDNFFDPVFVFNVASYCRAELTAYSSAKVWAEFGAGDADGQQYNCLSVVTSRTGAQIRTSNVTFNGSSSATNWVDGWGAGAWFRLTSAGLGVSIGNDSTSGIIGLGSTNNLEWQDASGNVLAELSSTQSIPRVPARNVRNVRYAGGYSASITPNMANGGHQVYSPNDGVAFTINAPTNAVAGDWLYLRFRNIHSAALGDITFNAAYKVASANPWILTDGSLLSKPANGYSRIIAFAYDGTSAWVEAWRSPADVPN